MKVRIIIALIAVAVLTIAPALLEGFYANRWGDPVDLTAAANQIKDFPRDIGNWELAGEGEPLHELVFQELGLVGYLSRSYSNRENGAVVSLLLMAGRSGPLVRHPPDICYANRANEQVGEMTKLSVDATKPPSEFNLLEYTRPESLTNEHFLVAYAMSTGSAWSAPRLPRVEFGGAPVLYKVQLLVTLDPSQNRDNGVALLEQFAADFCSAFQQHVLNDKAQPPRQAAVPQTAESNSDKSS